VRTRGLQCAFQWPEVIEPGAGEKKELAPLRLPEDVIARTVTGTARWADGRPVSGGWVTLLEADTKLRLSGGVRTTKNGEFEISAFAGQRVFVLIQAEDGERRGYVNRQDST
jgi:hypothetical protein